MQVAEEPSLLQGEFGVKDETTGRMIPRETLRQVWAEHMQVVELLRDLEAGIVHITLEEYSDRFPAILRDAWIIYKGIRHEAQRVQIQNLKA